MAERRPARRVLPDPVRASHAAVIGCGTVGAGWVARLRLHGVAVRVHDPSPAAPRILQQVLDRAVAATGALGLPTAPLGELDVCGSIAEAVADAELVQESVPERLEVKRAILAEIDAHAGPAAVIGSSTSGFTCSAMATALRVPERLVVAHPFVPVYLLPLVEVVGGEATSAATIERALSLYRGIGMRPVHVRAEIDAHLADRLLEAVWREALWLVHDGVATTAEIDDVIRFGFGLRWAQMGLFETYRIGGGAAGMRHFLAQFAPALSWPWSKLTDVPELDEALIEELVAQSDAQSGAYDIGELEVIRDRNLVAILRALESQGWGAGEVLAEARRAALGQRPG